eukprot:7050653-Pyramimonas_sp.AAC.1
MLLLAWSLRLVVILPCAVGMVLLSRRAGGPSPMHGAAVSTSWRPSPLRSGLRRVFHYMSEIAAQGGRAPKHEDLSLAP